MKKIKKLCLIEDDSIQVFITRQYIELLAEVEEILVYENGKEAFENLKKMSEQGISLPELILLDLFMPVWDGWEFLEEYIKLPLKESEKNIFILTSSLSSDDLEKANTYGLKGRFFTKPLDEKKLAIILSNTK
ncbi:MAG: response regulator [Cyclobacteriaceae bacterium]|nr:response regulator [Cyclobacteriaceae bacterium]